jgi:hypothetical protein
MTTPVPLRLLDAAVLVWVAAWIVIGGSMRSLGSVPLIGGQLRTDGEELQQAGAQAVTSAASAESATGTLSVLLALAVALLPSIPVLALYVPVRVARAREATSVRRALRLHGSDPQFQVFLARRAMQKLSYDSLQSVAGTRWPHLDDGELGELARLELQRLGIDPRTLPSPLKPAR